MANDTRVWLRSQRSSTFYPLGKWKTKSPYTGSAYNSGCLHRGSMHFFFKCFCAGNFPSISVKTLMWTKKRTKVVNTSFEYLLIFLNLSNYSLNILFISLQTTKHTFLLSIEYSTSFRSSRTILSSEIKLQLNFGLT